jgi:Xaa-Pro aminopeptidase
VPTPERPTDWLTMWAATLANQARWQQNECVRNWLAQCRLNNAVTMMRGVKPDDEVKLERFKEAAAKAGAAAAKLPELIASFA